MCMRCRKPARRPPRRSQIDHALIEQALLEAQDTRELAEQSMAEARRIRAMVDAQRAELARERQSGSDSQIVQSVPGASP